MMNFECGKLNLRNAHICDIWALLIICGSVVVKFVVSILQGKCNAGKWVSDQWSMANSAGTKNNTPLAVDFGGVT